jgi:hypothetical protein
MTATLRHLLPDELDEALIAARGFLGSVPVAGAALVEALNLVVGSPLEKRRSAWEMTVAQAILDLRNKRGIDFETLRDNSDFIDTVLSATAAAIRTSREEKREALRNAILNAGLSGAPDNFLQQVFVAAIDRLTDRHLLLLKGLQDPEAVRQRFNSSSQQSPWSLDEALRAVYEPLIGPRNLMELVRAELQSQGFCSVSEPRRSQVIRRPKTHNGNGTPVPGLHRGPFGRRALVGLRTRRLGSLPKTGSPRRLPPILPAELLAEAAI